jgi:hypothetical protein
LREKANPVLAAMTKDADEMGHFLPEGYVQQENHPVGMWKFSGRVNRKFACKQMHEVTWMTSPTFPQCNPVKQEVAPLFGLQNSFLTFSSLLPKNHQPKMSSTAFPLPIHLITTLNLFNNRFYNYR